MASHSLGARVGWPVAVVEMDTGWAAFLELLQHDTCHVLPLQDGKSVMMVEALQTDERAPKTYLQEHKDGSLIEA